MSSEERTQVFLLKTWSKKPSIFFKSRNNPDVLETNAEFFHVRFKIFPKNKLQSLNLETEKTVFKDFQVWKPEFRSLDKRLLRVFSRLKATKQELRKKRSELFWNARITRKSVAEFFDVRSNLQNAYAIFKIWLLKSFVFPKYIEVVMSEVLHNEIYFFFFSSNFLCFFCLQKFQTVLPVSGLLLQNNS